MSLHIFYKGGLKKPHFSVHLCVCKAPACWYNVKKPTKHTVLTASVVCGIKASFAWRSSVAVKLVDNNAILMAHGNDHGHFAHPVPR